jgi:hypothetical protein
MPEVTLNALANRKEVGSIPPADGGDCEEVSSLFADWHRHQVLSWPTSGGRRKVVRQLLG